jgi:glycoprotein endo-alpha-1,2-mannosidase
MKKIVILTIVVLLAACNGPAQVISTPKSVVTATVSSPASTLPSVEGPDPSYKVAAFYYPWYGNPENDGEWIHWNDGSFHPPLDITSDYFPELGAYSSNDPAVVAQHMAWLRQVGIGVIVVSWWGQGCREERPVPLLLQMAGRYGIKVTFHIEPYAGRTANRLVEDIKYLYRKYGSDPAFFLSDATSRYSTGSQPKPMFFVWAIGSPDSDSAPVLADYWQAAMDAIHALPQGALVIANTLQGSWIIDGHFDGLYNYATLHLDREGGFAWAASLPPDSLYVPSVIPGFSAVRIGYSADSLVPRQDGRTYANQWTAALGTGVQPVMVSVTSFNEWHEGSMIEPPAIGADDGQGYAYPDFGGLPPEGFLDLTREWVDTYLATTWPETYRTRIQVTTTSDWTTLNIVSGGAWLRPELVSANPAPVYAGMEAGDRFALTQPLADAERGLQVQMTWDLLLSGLDPAGNLVLNIERGNIGETTVTVFNYLGDTPVSVKKYYWNGISGGRNSYQVTIPASALITSVP